MDGPRNLITLNISVVFFPFLLENVKNSLLTKIFQLNTEGTRYSLNNDFNHFSTKVDISSQRLSIPFKQRDNFEFIWKLSTVRSWSAVYFHKDSTKFLCPTERRSRRSQLQILRHTVASNVKCKNTKSKFPLFVSIRPAAKFKRGQKYKLPLSYIFGRNYHDTLWEYTHRPRWNKYGTMRYLFLEAIKNAASRGYISYRRANWVTLKSNAGFIACEGNISKETTPRKAIRKDRWNFHARCSRNIFHNYARATSTPPSPENSRTRYVEV